MNGVELQVVISSSCLCHTSVDSAASPVWYNQRTTVESKDFVVMTGLFTLVEWLHPWYRWSDEKVGYICVVQYLCSISAELCLGNYFLGKIVPTCRCNLCHKRNFSIIPSIKYACFPDDYWQTWCCFCELWSVNMATSLKCTACNVRFKYEAL